jgi:hypothetical protein
MKNEGSSSVGIAQELQKINDYSTELHWSLTSSPVQKFLLPNFSTKLYADCVN